MSKTLATVGLNGAKFNAAIGWYAEERVFKNNFVVDLAVTFKVLKSLDHESLDSSIDYMILHQICERFFAQESKLIESVAQKVIDEIVLKFPFSEEIELTIKKLSPPVKAQIESSFVRLRYKK